VRAVALGAGGRFAVTAGDDVKLWSGADGALVRRFDAPADLVAVTPDGRWVATARTSEAAPLLWNARTGVTTRDFAGHRAGVVALALSPDGAWLATASEDETVRLWEVTTGREVRRLGGKVRALCLAWSADGRFVAAGADRPERVCLYDAATGSEVATRSTAAGEAPRAVAVTPDGRAIVTGTSRREFLVPLDGAPAAAGAGAGGR
jgi:WD40 repeat protein